MFFKEAEPLKKKKKQQKQVAEECSQERFDKEFGDLEELFEAVEVEI